MSDTIYRIVVGTDFSDTANIALRKAFDLAAKEENGEVHVVNAVRHLGEYVQMDLPDTPAYRLPLDEAQDKIEAHVGGQLAAWQSETGRTFSRCVTYLSTEFPAVGVAQLATDLDAEMIVIGTHGRQGLRRLIIGSVAEAVVRLAHVPVLVVRPKEEQAEAPEIQPPCPKCVEARKASGGKQVWCEQHLERHGRRHAYHYQDRVARDGNIGGLNSWKG
jgi:nucleotide-binding universal stress UspA family protein